MAEVSTTFNVPAEHVETFRLAALHEAEYDAQSYRASLEERNPADAEDEVRAGIRQSDIQSQAENFGATAAVVAQLAAVKPGEATKVRSDAGTLAHVLETMAQKVIAPRIASETNYGPLDTDALGTLTNALAWLNGESEVMYARAVEELAQRREAVTS